MVVEHRNTDGTFPDHIRANFPYPLSGFDSAWAKAVEWWCRPVQKNLNLQDTMKEIVQRPSPGVPGHTANHNNPALATHVVAVEVMVALVVLRFPLLYSIE